MYLIVDDDDGVIRMLRRRYRDRKDVVCVLCESVDAVEEARGLFTPEVLIFDHSIRDGDQPGGFIIAREFTGMGIELISNSADISTARKYAQLGVRCIGKEFDALDELLTTGSVPSSRAQ